MTARQTGTTDEVSGCADVAIVQDEVSDREIVFFTSSGVDTDPVDLSDLPSTS